MSKTKIERRTISADLRADSQGDEQALVGYAALFNHESNDLGGWRETIAPSAFVRSLRNGDTVYCLHNHNADQVLGSTKSGTLALTQDQRGLKFRCLINQNDTLARSVYARVQRRDLDACSFAFTVAAGGDLWNSDRSQRTLTDINLMDVSCVAYPAYPDTSVAARAARHLPLADYTIRIPSMAELQARVSRLGKAISEQRARDARLQCEIDEALKSYGYNCIEIDEDNKVAYGASDDMEENSAVRFGYELDDAGHVTLDKPARAKRVSHLWVSSERGQELKRLAELRMKMRAAAGLPGRK